MNSTLETRDVDAILRVLDRGLVLIRLAAMEGNVRKAEALADALHNGPRLLLDGDEYGWSVAVFRDIFLGGLAASYPEEHRRLNECFEG